MARPKAATRSPPARAVPGFTAQIAGNLDGRPFDGTISINAKGEVSFSDNVPAREESVATWVQEQLESIVLHRIARVTADRGKPVVWYAEDRDDHPLGRLMVFEGGRFASSYRVKDRQILVVKLSTSAPLKSLPYLRCVHLLFARNPNVPDGRLHGASPFTMNYMSERRRGAQSAFGGGAVGKGGADALRVGAARRAASNSAAGPRTALVFTGV
jgi:hypothetical protein